jgi:precorrin-6A/cobalt-precorrin-6A reductase
MSKRVWLIGGTQESTELAIALAHAQIPCIVSVTTDAAQALYSDPVLVPWVDLWIGRLMPDQIGQFLQEQHIICVLDASHPFAVEISKLAIATASVHQVPYLRYERLRVDRGAEEQGSKEDGEMEISRDGGDRNQEKTGLVVGCPLYLDNFEALFASELLPGERVLLTLGYRPLAQFQPWQERCKLFARILPSMTALEVALVAGFTPDRLIAIRPPISAELERSLWQQWQISMVVTKASGIAGGEDVKRQVAAELGIKLVIINRPPVMYPQQTSDLQTAIEFCIKHYATTA